MTRPAPRFGALCLAALCLSFLCQPVAAARDAYGDGLKAYRAGQYAQAYKQLLPLARKKDARAMYLIGVMYQSGRAVPQDDPTAAGWFEASAKLGNASGQYALARATIEGRGVEKNRDKGIALLQLAAAQGHSEATALLGRLAATLKLEEGGLSVSRTLSGTGARAPADATANPPTELFTPLDRVAAQASLSALRTLLQRLAAADDAGLRKSLPSIASGFARQYWHVESVGDAGLADGFSRVARDHAVQLVPLAGELSGSNAPESQAVGGLLLRLAGSPSPALRTGCPATIAAAQAGFAFAYFQGARCIVERDALQASDWMRAAAAAGHAGAQESVGRSCVEGENKDWRCDTDWLARAANIGRASAMPVLGWALASQPDASLDDQRAALGWYEKAADNGDLFAMNNLAALLERGPVALRDASAARRRYAQAARTGFAPAQFNLGRMLAQGIGGTADLDEAAEWLRKAAAAGVPEAQTALDQLKR